MRKRRSPRQSAPKSSPHKSRRFVKSSSRKKSVHIASKKQHSDLTALLQVHIRKLHGNTGRRNLYAPKDLLSTKRSHGNSKKRSSSSQEVCVRSSTKSLRGNEERRSSPFTSAIVVTQNSSLTSSIGNRHRFSSQVPGIQLLFRPGVCERAGTFINDSSS